MYNLCVSYFRGPELLKIYLVISPEWLEKLPLIFNQTLQEIMWCMKKSKFHALRLCWPGTCIFTENCKKRRYFFVNLPYSVRNLEKKETNDIFKKYGIQNLNSFSNLQEFAWNAEIRFHQFLSAQFGNLAILLPLRFCVKSCFGKCWVSKSCYLTFSRALDFNIGRFQSLRIANICQNQNSEPRKYSKKQFFTFSIWYM